jgi:hypothetical protein
MKAIYLTITALLIFTSAHSQETSKNDSTVAALKTYLVKYIRPSPIMMEKHIQGRSVIAFKIGADKKITGIHFLKPLTNEYDDEVARVLKLYPQDLLLPPAEYSISVQFLIENRKYKSAPFDKSVYQNFLFDLDIVSNFPY